MNIIKTSIPDLVILEPHVFHDQRGYFFESFSQREFDEKVRPIRFVQDNESMRTYGVMRGLHYQKMPHTRASKCAAKIGDFIFDRQAAMSAGTHDRCYIYILTKYRMRVRNSLLVVSINKDCP